MKRTIHVVVGIGAGPVTRCFFYSKAFADQLVEELEGAERAAPSGRTFHQFSMDVPSELYDHETEPLVAEEVRQRRQNGEFSCREKAKSRKSEAA